MKLIYITNSRIPTEKAHGLQIMKMCEAFTSNNLDLELIIPKRINIIKKDIFNYYGIKYKFVVKKLFTIDLIAIFDNKFFFLLQNVSFSFSVLLYLLNDKNRIIIYSRDFISIFILSFFKRFKLHYEIHAFPEKISFFYKRVFKRVKFIAITQGLKDELIKNGVSEKNIIVAHDGVDLDLFNSHSDNKFLLREKFNLPKNKKIISYIGKLTTMGKAKGVEFLIKSFSNVIKNINNAYLLIVGINENEIRNIKKLFTDENISEDNYLLVKHTSHDNVISYEKASDVLIMNYPNEKHYRFYMSPLKMFEYMASGNPIVSTDLESIREVLNIKNSILVKPDDLSELSGAIYDILTNDDLANSISTQALKDVENFTWNKRAENIINFIDLSYEK